MTDREPVNIMGVIAFPEPDKSKRRIRFIDAEYNTLFYIPDGASIVMTRMDGSSVIRPCTYIDDYRPAGGAVGRDSFAQRYLQGGSGYGGGIGYSVPAKT